MSRAYRIKVSENLKRVITAKDGVQTTLEVLEVLPCEQMADLLKEELARRGFEEKDGVMVRRDKDVTITVDPETGTVSVTAEQSQKVDLTKEKETRAYDDIGASAQRAKKALRESARKELQQEAEAETAKLQSKVADRLAGRLQDLRQELDQAVNRVTAEALKIKAAQMGQIKELTEDPQSGSLTIVVEV